MIDILVILAHPDDAELCCAGTLLSSIEDGLKVGMVDLTRGELGTRGSAELRDKEASVAASILGVSIRENMNFRDGFFSNDDAHRMELIRVIRKYRPEIILCNAIMDRHPDHSKASQLVYDSYFLSGLRKILTDQDVWRPKAIYHYIQFKSINPDFVVDVSDYMVKKIEAVRAYKSQFFDPNSNEPETIISSKSFLDSIEYRASDLGRLSGVNYAEGFTVERVPVISSLDDFL